MEISIFQEELRARESERPRKCWKIMEKKKSREKSIKCVALFGNREKMLKPITDKLNSCQYWRLDSIVIYVRERTASGEMPN